MHVPYSMDDSEPDLYGGMGGYMDDDQQDLYSSRNGRDGGYGDGGKCPELPLPKPAPMFTFANERELVSSEVFQRYLCAALKHKDKDIHELRVEILELHDKLENK